MTFLNSLLLFAMTAAAIPVIIHLLNLHRRQVVDFSTLRFLKMMQQKQMRRLKVRQWWLLLLRVLVLVLLVIAFARPALRRWNSLWKGHEQTTAVLMIDNSASTAIAGTFDLMREYGMHILEQMQDGDEVALLPLVQSYREPLKTHRVATLRDELAGLQPVALPDQAEWAFSQATELLQNSTNLNRELYIISDFAWQSEPKDSSLFHIDDAVQVYFLPVLPDEYRNLALSEPEITRSLAGHDPVTRMQVHVENQGVHQADDVQVSVLLNETRVAQQSLDVPAGENGELSFDLLIPESDFVQGQVRLENSVSDFDNTVYFGLHSPAGIRIALIADDDRMGDQVDRALNPDRNQDARLRVDRFSSVSWQSQDPDRYDVVFLISVHLSTASLNYLARAVRKGTGVLIFPPVVADPAREMRNCRELLKLPPVQSVKQVETTSMETAHLADLELSHSFFAGMFAGEEQVHSPRIRFYYQYVRETRVEPLLTLSSGDLYAGTYSLGEGRVLFLSAPLHSEVTDFAQRGFFAPFVHRAAVWLSPGGRQQVKRSAAGSEQVLDLEQTGEQWRVIDPAGDWVPQVIRQAGGTRVPIPASIQPGVFPVQCDGEPVALLVRNLPDGEARILPDHSDAWRSLIRPDGIVIRDPDQAGKIIQKRRTGRELWFIFLLLAAGLYILEGLLGKRN